MKKKVTVKTMGSKRELQEFLEKLTNASSDEEIESLLELDTGSLSAEESKPCASPLCPDCMWRHGRDPQEVREKVLECVELMSRDELKHAFAGAIALITTLYRDCHDEHPAIHEMGGKFCELIARVRRLNEKFAFATQSDFHGEGAKH